MPSLFIDPNAEAEYNEEENKTVLDMILDIHHTEIQKLCLTVWEKMQSPDSTQFIKDFMKKGTLISQHNNRAFISSQMFAIYGNLSVYSNNNKIMKIVNCACDQPLAEFDIIREIAMQQYATGLQSVCSFKVPTIREYGKILLDNNNLQENFTFNCLYYFTMDKIDAKTLQEYIQSIDLDNTCTPLVKKINSIHNCLIDNNLHHNDYHVENIMVDPHNNINVIDYGLATETPTLIEEDEPYTCAKLNAIKKTTKTKNKGGRRKKTKKTKRKACKLSRRR